jgi:hypothetical protein
MMEHTNQLQGLLDIAPISRIRRNHGLEHATLHVLSERHPVLPMAGHSDSAGFWILGDLSTEEIVEAVKEALTRLQAGEANLAIHPNCGTNFATAGVLAGAAASLAMFGVGKKLRDNLERVPNAIVLAIIALVLAQPLGLMLQQYVTTSGQPGNMHLTGVQFHNRGKITVHRVLTEG